MKLKFAAVILILTAVLLLPVYGYYYYYDETLDRVVDDADLLSDDEEALLRSRISNITYEYEFDIVIVTANTLDGKSPMEYADDYYDYNGYGYGGSRDGLLLLLSMEDRDWWITTTGNAIPIFLDKTLDYMGESMLDDLKAENYHSAFDTFVTLTEEYYTGALDNIDYYIPDEVKYFFFDYTDIFTYTEELFLMDRMQDIKSKYNFDAAVVTVTESGGYTMYDFAEDYQSTNWHENGNGMLLLVNVDEPKLYIYTKGYGETAFTEYGVNYIVDSVSASLYDYSSYYSGIDSALLLCDYFLEAAAAGTPYDYENPYVQREIDEYREHSDSNLSLYILIAFIASLVISLIVVSVMKHNMNTIRFQSNANTYIKKDSLRILNSRDLFLYSNTTKTKRQTETSSSGGGGGSSSHRSSSGSSHGGRGGKF